MNTIKTQENYLKRYDSTADPALAIGLVVQWLRSDWRDFFAELREHRPVFATPLFTVVTRFADVTEVLSLEKVFTVAGYTTLDAAIGGPMMLTRDATAMNWRERGLMQVMLGPDEVPAVRELVGRVTDEILDAAEPNGRIEAVGDLFREVSIRVCAEHFGFPGPDSATLSRWSRAIITDVTANLSRDPAVHAASVQAGSEMMTYLRGLLAQRRAELAARGGPEPHDTFSRLARTVLPAEVPFDDERLVVNATSLLLGFLENSAGSMTNLVEQLLLRPDVAAAAAQAAGSPDRFDPYVWEALRFNPFLKLIARVTAQDHLIAAGTTRATLIPAGTVVLAAAASAMFDPDVVAVPDDFRLDRPGHRQLHFGYGHHACLGVDAGAAVVSELVRRLLRRPGLRLLPAPDGTIVRNNGVFPDRFVLGLGPAGEKGL